MPLNRRYAVLLLMFSFLAAQRNSRPTNLFAIKILVASFRAHTCTKCSLFDVAATKTLLTFSNYMISNCLLFCFCPQCLFRFFSRFCFVI